MVFPEIDDISLAEWALVEEIRAGQWKNLDFPRVAREEFGLNGIEFVNTLFESPTERYLQKLIQNAQQYAVTMVLVMVDEEGDACSDSKQGRQQFVINHRKWTDIAAYLGCHAIRTNCIGPADADKQEALKWAAESYQQLLDYCAPSKLNIVIENHGGVSNDPEWMLDLMKEANSPRLGVLPDWRNPGPLFDNFNFLKKTLPFAKGMSYRNQPEDALTLEMIRLCQASGYKGWYGIESKGRAEVEKGVRLLREAGVGRIVLSSKY